VWRGYAGGAFEVSDEAKAPESALRRARQDIDYAARVVGTERWTAEWLIPFQALGIAEALPAVPLRLPANLTVRMAVEEKWLMWHRPHGFSWKVNEAGTLELIP
jgi:hypothetical protein